MISTRHVRTGYWLLLWMLAGACMLGTKEQESAQAERADSGNAAQLFARHCAICHGPRGRGDGPPAPVLFPPARDFASGQFRLVSTANGVPSDADLVALLRRGMPGSAMPAFAWMEEHQLKGLANYVRELAIDEMAEELVRLEGGSRTEQESAKALEEARARLTPGKKLAVGPAAPATQATLAQGERLYRERCAACHGEDGRGRPDEPTWSADGSLRWARDLRAGILKGGRSHEEIAHRILAGMPGSAMPASQFTQPQELAALTTYVLSLIPETAHTDLLLQRETILARRTAVLPADPMASSWTAIPATRLALTPLWWHESAVLSLCVRAAHDGQDLALLLEWSDPSEDAADPALARAGDGLAVQLSNDAEPALFGMGSHEHPTNLWYWVNRQDWELRADDPHRLRAAALERALFGESRTDVSSGARSERTNSAESIPGEGPIRVGQRAQRLLDLQAFAERSPTGWRLMLRRSLTPHDTSEIALSTGTSLQMAFAVWNASGGDEGGRKSISIWQEFRLEP